MRVFMLFFLFLSVIVTLQAQKDSISPISIGFNHGRGFIMSHSPNMARLANRHISTNEIYFEFNSHGKKDWHQRFNFPSTGFTVKHFKLNNPQMLGNALAIGSFLKLKLISGKNAMLTIKPTIGLGYIQKTFDEDLNYRNIAIGSNINMYLSVVANFETKIYQSVYSSIGLSFDHMSNTGFQSPNLGINMPLIYAGVKTDLGKKKLFKYKTESKYEPTKYKWRIETAVGLNEKNPAKGKKYLAKALFIKREKKINRKSSIGFGIDLYNNPANQAILSEQERDISNIENTQLAASINHALHFGKLKFTSQLSYYLISENEDLGNIYHVFGGRYEYSESFDFIFSGKTHIDKAEFFMVGVGYTIK